MAHSVMDHYLVTPGSTVRLMDRDPSERLTFDGRKRLGRRYLAELTTRLRELQELLYAEGRHRVLVVLQARTDARRRGHHDPQVILHISREEQATRLRSRLADPAKHWKFDPEDLEDRRLWDDYQEAFDTMLTRTSTSWAPWRVVPANSKWYRNLVVARTLVQTLESLGMRYPRPDFDPSLIQVE